MIKFTIIKTRSAFANAERFKTPTKKALVSESFSWLVDGKPSIDCKSVLICNIHRKSNFVKCSGGPDGIRTRNHRFTVSRFTVSLPAPGTGAHLVYHPASLPTDLKINWWVVN